MSDIDVKKLKVTELRDELKKHGLETKGNKPELVKRLEKFLAGAGGSTSSGPDDSTAESQGEDLDTSQADTSQAEDAGDKSTVGQADTSMTQQEPLHEKVEDSTPVVETPQPDQPVSKPEPCVSQSQEVSTECVDKMESADVEPLKVVSDEVPESINEEMPYEAKIEDEAPDDSKDETPSEADAWQEQDAYVAPMEEDGSNASDVKGHEGEEEQSKDEPKESHHKRERSDSRSEQRNGDRDRERRRSRSPHHKRSRSRSPETKRSRFDQPADLPMEDTEWVKSTDVRLDPFNCDLSMEVDKDGYTCTPLSQKGFGYMWSGIRATYGVAKGKVAFQVKITKDLHVNIGSESVGANHVTRVGWSPDIGDLQLGEVPLTYGYGGTGKFSTDCKFTDYGEPFRVGDVVTAYLDMSADPVVISFAKNGAESKMACEVPKESLGNAALFPSLCVKNQSVEVNFGQKEEPWFPLADDFEFIGKFPLEERVRALMPPASKEDCEVLLLIGLPGAGKSYWAAQQQKERPEKRYYVLGTNNIIDKMKVDGLARRQNYNGRWDILFDQANDCLRRMIEVAARRLRNYILDQTNVYEGAQKRKMRPFAGFKRKAVIVLPTDEVFKQRIEKRTKEEGKDIPTDAVLEMKANFHMPKVETKVLEVKDELKEDASEPAKASDGAQEADGADSELPKNGSEASRAAAEPKETSSVSKDSPVEESVFDEVIFTELSGDEARQLIDKYIKEGQEKFPPGSKRFRREDRRFAHDRYGGDRRYDNRPGSRDSRDSRYSSGGSRYESRGSGRYEDRNRSYGGSSYGGGGYGSGGYGSGGYGSGGYGGGGYGGGSYGGGYKSGGGSSGGYKDRTPASYGKSYGSGGYGGSGYGSQGSGYGSGSWGGQGYWSGQQGGWGSSQGYSQGYGSQGYGSGSQSYSSQQSGYSSTPSTYYTSGQSGGQSGYGSGGYGSYGSSHR